jgi:hypothetical protein
MATMKIEEQVAITEQQLLNALAGMWSAGYDDAKEDLLKGRMVDNVETKKLVEKKLLSEDDVQTAGFDVASEWFRHNTGVATSKKRKVTTLT